ncbi:MAG: hypothetical protein AAB116_22405 [Candidatus Poribacteria bacterium]
MEIIDAHWDDENLGVKSFEIVLSSHDKMSDFLLHEEQLIVEKNARYIVVKAPVNVPDFLFELPKLNYIFLETAFSLSLKKDNYKYPSFLARFDRSVEVRSLEDSYDLERIYGEISKGIFNTDRVAIDRNFTQQIANNRYIRWISSLVKQGEKVHEVYIDNKAIGFFILKSIDNNSVRGILTGLYEKYSTSGYGLLIMKKLNDTVWNYGYKTYIAQVVSNNIKALRANLIFGSEIESMAYTYVKSL